VNPIKNGRVAGPGITGTGTGAGVGSGAEVPRRQGKFGLPGAQPISKTASVSVAKAWRKQRMVDPFRILVSITPAAIEASSFEDLFYLNFHPRDQGSYRAI
jgi:hypothetical protein